MYTPGRSELTTEDRYEIRGLGSSFLEETKGSALFLKELKRQFFAKGLLLAGQLTRRLRTDTCSGVVKSAFVNQSLCRAYSSEYSCL